MEFPKFKVNHLVTFTSTSQKQQTYHEGIKRLQEVEEVVGVWRQKVVIQLDKHQLNILDSKSNEIIEHFPIISVHKPEAIDYNSNYNNLLLFTVYLSKESAEMHIFDCHSNNASNIVVEITEWRKRCLQSLPRMVSTNPIVNHKQKELKTYALIDKYKSDSQILEDIEDNNINTKVKQTVDVFNQIAIQRQKSDKINKIFCNQENQLEDKLQIEPKKLQPFRYF